MTKPKKTDKSKSKASVSGRTPTPRKSVSRKRPDTPVDDTLIDNVTKPKKADKSKSEATASGRTPTPRKSVSRKRADTPVDDDTNSATTVAKKTKKIRRPYTYFVGNKPHKMSVKLKKEILHFQQIVTNLIPKLPFCRVIREVLQEHSQGEQYRIQPEALEGIQVAAEMYLTQLFEDSNRCAAHANRVTLRCKDMDLVLYCRQRYDPLGINK